MHYNPYISLEYRDLSHIPHILHFVKDNNGRVKILAPSLIPTLRKPRKTLSEAWQDLIGFDEKIKSWLLK
jgi:hypothetical protein